MKGTIVTIGIGGGKLTTTIEGAPQLETLKAGVGGGWIELIPQFDSYEVAPGEVVSCVAFCDEEGKLKNLTTNNIATVLWDKAMRRAGGPGLLQRDGTAADYLVGQIAIVFGDDEFMEAL